MICAFRDCSKQLSVADNLWGSEFCRPDHRTAEHAIRRHEDGVAVKADALSVIRNITTAHVGSEQARILALAFKDDELLRAGVSF